MEAYLKSIIFFTLLAAIVNQMLPGEAYRKVIGIVCGFLLLLLFLKPLLTQIGLQKEIFSEFNRLAREGGNRERSTNLEPIKDILKEQYEEQIRMLVCEYTGNSQCEVKVLGNDEDSNTGSISHVTIVIPGIGEERAEDVKAMVCELYSLAKRQVEITGR